MIIHQQVFIEVTQMRSSHTFLPIILLLAGLSLAGCGSKLPALKTYKMDIQQGNVVTSKMLLQLRPGMTKSQVRYIMGTPLVVDSFHTNRWDYFYQLRQQGKVVEKRRVILDFDKDQLVAVRGDVVAASDKTAETPVDTSARSVTPPKQAAESSWLDKLMFWKSETPPEVAAEVAKDSASASKDTAVAATEAVAVAAEAVAPSAETGGEPESVLRKKVEPLLAPEESLGVAAVPVVPDTSVAEANPASNASAEAPIANDTPVEVEAAKPAELVKLAEPVATNQHENAVKDAVTQWADAWRNKNIATYLSAYADKFKPEGGLSKKAWVAQRKKRLADKQGAISLTLEDVVVAVDGNKASAQFYQQYSSKVYSDQVTKQLDFELDAKTKRWLIVKEAVVSNAKKENQQKVLAPEETSEHLDGVIEKIGF